MPIGQIGWNTAWLDLHGLFMFGTLVFGAFLFGAVYFRKDPDETFLRRLRLSAVGTFLMVLGLMITGIVPDTAFGSGASFSGTITNDFGIVTRSVTDAQLGNFTGPLLFDLMEHASLVVPGLTAVIAFLIWNQGRKVITEPTVKTAVLSLMAVNGAWLFALGAIGVYITKVLTFPVGG
jgi:hypothetical protein